LCKPFAENKHGGAENVLRFAYLEHKFTVLVSENADLSMSISFRRKRGRPVKQLLGFTPTLKAQGSIDGPLRTPRNFADPAAGKSELPSMRASPIFSIRGADFYKVRCTGLDERSDTTEPVAHLSDDASKAKIQAYLHGRAALEPPSKAV
jgi:hypothetical protein